MLGTGPANRTSVASHEPAHTDHWIHGAFAFPFDPTAGFTPSLKGETVIIAAVFRAVIRSGPSPA